MSKLNVEGKSGKVLIDTQVIDGYDKIFDEVSKKASNGALTEVDFMMETVKKISSSGIAKLLTVKNLLDNYGVRMRIKNLSPDLLDVFKKFKVDGKLGL
ncbi:STAS domain-containing protein [Leptospira gomenensis]|uniref:STAS domain-containing protein n=1 Tax=Leptospira gomenensis TaxID=2484974 RepID=A0A5F1YRP1_9LEPT|nr:STAS domain-containing protein [Leptospira gomenensis]TGK38601.1 STAS domain-containing protein [Leptospira gomenensis]TGK42838.1 STAS domain-containing protein [Leptospira gomenensis]TGK49617.1 STAS domain-containing protein [Leptospira gomenensis]TGK60713.1 STAS domain-containing protein [Leptospira gomenensis]